MTTVYKKGSKDAAGVKAIQEQLLKLGYDLGITGADGDFGPATETAVKSFQTKVGLKPVDGIVGKDTSAALDAAVAALPAPTPVPPPPPVPPKAEDRSKFYASLKTSGLASSFDQSQVDGFEAILNTFKPTSYSIPHRAYMLATAWHETARKMKPIEEYGKGSGRDYGKRLKMSRVAYNDTPAIFYGRGYVQLTWYENYELAGKKLGLDLLHKPELTLTPDVASKIMLMGMEEGWFTGKKLNDYLNDKTKDYVNSRRIINGTDKASEIAAYANKFETALKAMYN